MGRIDSQIHLSRFLRSFERDGLTAVVHQLHPRPLYVLSHTWAKLNASLAFGTPLDGFADLVVSLVDEELFVPSPHVDDRAFQLARTRALHRMDRPTILYLMLAQHCDCACSYCPIPGLAVQHGERLLSYDDAVAGITRWEQHISDYPPDDDPYFVIFYGGEPLLNTGVFKRLLAHCAAEQAARRLPIRLERMLCTNGSFVDHRIAALAQRYGLTVAIGIDGPESFNDLTRVTAAGEPTYATIERAIALLRAHDVPVVASVTITPRNAEVLQHFPEQLRQMGVCQFGFNLLKGDRLWELAPAVRKDYIRLAARVVLAGLHNGAPDYQLTKRLEMVQSGLPFAVDCTCMGNQLVIQPDGQVTNCPFLRVDQGHVQTLPVTFRIQRTATVAAWRQRLPIVQGANADWTPTPWLDGGGCAWSVSRLAGTPLAADAPNTLFVQEVMHELVWTPLTAAGADTIRRCNAPYWRDRRNGSL